MSCNCNTANPNCEPCSICTPPGVTGLTTCQPPDPCEGETIDINCVTYSGESFPCVTVQTGDTLIQVLLQLLQNYVPSTFCCDLQGNIGYSECGIAGNIQYYVPVITSTSTTTTSTAAPACSFYQIVNVNQSGSSSVNYVPCNSTTDLEIIVTTSVIICVNNNYSITTLSGQINIINLGVCNSAGPTTTTTTTTSICECNIYTVENTSNSPIKISYTRCENGQNILTTATINKRTTIEVCSCIDILDNVNQSLIITPSGVVCTGTPTTSTTSTTTAYVPICNCYIITNPTGNTLSFQYQDCVEGFIAVGHLAPDQTKYQCSFDVNFVPDEGLEVTTLALCDDVDCILPTTTTTTQCARPGGLKTGTFGYAVTTCTAPPPDDTTCDTIDFTAALVDACDAYQSLPDTTLGSSYTQIETLTVQLDSNLTIGSTVYLGTSTDCSIVDDGWYWYSSSSSVLPEESVSEFLGLGTIQIVHVVGGVIESVSDCILELFSINARLLTDITMDYLLCYTDPITVIWGDGTYDTYPAFVAPTPIYSPTHSYSTPFTGQIKVVTRDLSNVVTFSIIDTVTPNIPSSSVPSNSLSNFYVSIDSTYSLLDGLQFSTLGNCYLSCSVTELPRTLKNFACRYANISGNISDLPTGIINLSIGNYNTVGGDIIDFPRTLRTITVTGDNNIGGDIADIPIIDVGIGNTGVTLLDIEGSNTIQGDLASISGVAPDMTTFNIQGINTLTGDISNLPCDKLITCAIVGDNTVSGDISAFAGNTDLVVLEFLGLTTVSGNLSSLTGCTGLRRVFIDGKSLDPLTGSTITGNISSLPTGLFRFVLGGNNTITGSLSTFAAMTQLNYLVVNGDNTLNGDISDIPVLVSYLSIEGANTINAYSTTKTWPSTMYNFRVSSTDPLCTLSTADLDQLILDLDGVGSSRIWTTFLPPTTPGGNLVARGTYTGSGAVLTAYNSLVSKIGALAPYGYINIV